MNFEKLTTTELLDIYKLLTDYLNFLEKNKVEESNE